MDIWHYPRKSLTKLIIAGMKNGLLDRVTIFAPRKRGKTQFITKDIIPACEQHDILPIYIDFWADKASPENAFINGVLQALEANKHPLIKQFNKMKITPQLSLNGPSVKFEANSKAELNASLAKTYQTLNEHDGPILLLLDEVQHLASDKTFLHFTASLRSFMTARGDNKIKGVFTGSSQEGLNKLFKETKAPFYDASQTLPFKPLDKDFVEFQLSTFTKATGGKTLNIDDAFNIFQKQKLNPARFSNLLKRMVLQGIYEIREGFDHLDNEYLAIEIAEFTRKISALKKLDKILLVMIAKGEGTNIYNSDSVEDIQEQFGKKANSSLIGASLKRMGNKDLIYNQSRGVWKIADPALQDFLLSRIDKS